MAEDFLVFNDCVTFRRRPIPIITFRAHWITQQETINTQGYMNGTFMLENNGQAETRQIIPWTMSRYLQREKGVHFFLTRQQKHMT